MNASPIITHNPVNPNAFDATLRVAGATITPDTNTETVIITFGDDGERALTPGTACALAAALQAVAVHVMEQRSEVAA